MLFRNQVIAEKHSEAAGSACFGQQMAVITAKDIMETVESRALSCIEPPDPEMGADHFLRALQSALRDLELDEALPSNVSRLGSYSSLFEPSRMEVSSGASAKKISRSSVNIARFQTEGPNVARLRALGRQGGTKMTQWELPADNSADDKSKAADVRIYSKKKKVSGFDIWRSTSKIEGSLSFGDREREIGRLWKELHKSIRKNYNNKANDLNRGDEVPAEGAGSKAAESDSDCGKSSSDEEDGKHPNHRRRHPTGALRRGPRSNSDGSESEKSESEEEDESGEVEEENGKSVEEEPLELSSRGLALKFRKMRVVGWKFAVGNVALDGSPDSVGVLKIALQPHPWVGKMVRRFYEGEPTDGKLVAFQEAGADPDEDPPLWHMVHLDGDGEDLDEDEVKAALTAYENAHPQVSNDPDEETSLEVESADEAENKKALASETVLDEDALERDEDLPPEWHALPEEVHRNNQKSAHQGMHFVD